ncbi:hypothetical protein [Paraburkholderia eburnea]|uniref:hypothetical protein n=1 Tax=Paraburkholderia eburnea TaxID=1189126 RepID=UPI00142DD23A|nr:hypothetical protein [Paraburkholderia eburnea]
MQWSSVGVFGARCNALFSHEALCVVLLALLLFTAAIRHFLPQASHLAENYRSTRKRFNKRTSVRLLAEMREFIRSKRKRLEP